MNLTVNRFTIILFSILVGVLLSIFSYYHLSQQEKTASVILKSINSNISETSYIISKSITSKESIRAVRPLLDRVSANNQFVVAILVHDENKILVSTDPHYRTILSANDILNGNGTSYTKLLNAKGIQNNINFYKSNQLQTLKLLFILDQDEISLYFDEKQSTFLIYFAFIPMLLVILILLIMRYFISRPLESLRQYAYYQNIVPKKYKIRELETIRYSMIQTFNRLEDEKEELYLMSRTDELSGLANKNSLSEYLNRLIKNSKRNNEEFAFLFLDLDNFKTVNDSLGHNVGDELLKQVAFIVNKVLRPSDFVARVGGDEFVIVIKEYDSVIDLTHVVDRVLSQLSKPWIINTYPISISASVGISFYPKDGENMVSLMQHSDIAMYEAKKNGRARYHFFTEELNQSVQNIIKLENDMKDALANDEFELYYQPKVDVATSKIIGAEALIRWISPDRGMVSPDEFISIAEENNFIIELGTWIVQDAVKQQRTLKDKGIDIIISINISAKQILEDGFVDMLIKTLETYKVSPKDIDIEITEYMFLKQNEKNHNVLNELSSYGVSISLDDFGTGYSSLSYLKKFPVDYIKIDKSFLDDFNTQQGAVFIDTIIQMGHNLNMKVIAEGIELDEQLQYIKDIGCDQYQGYYFSKPLNTYDFENLFLKHN